MISSQLGSSQFGVVQLGCYSIPLQGSSPSPSGDSMIANVLACQYITLQNFYKLMGRWPWTGESNGCEC
jgi:hypothetical protein